MITLYIKKKKFNESFELNDIPLEITPGKITLLLGHNGAGKTTIIKSLFGLLKFEGEVTVNGHNIFFNSQHDVDYFKKQIAYIPDDISLFDYLAPREYFQLMESSCDGKQDPSFVRNLIRIFELEKYLNTPIVNLSHGNQKKVQIVSQLIKKSNYIAFDEPTNGLDPDMIIILKKVLVKLKSQGVGILLSTHNLHFGQELFDNIVILREGIMKLSTNKQELNKNFGEVSLEEIYKIVNQDYYQYVEGLLNELDTTNNL
ncbi:ATP-binding cassette domain-containing protein [Neobacillus jeddahensis]|uniref:ATP-binding cassette domain-containing protein n=1 Tax=Neobacillus jeddahensis TaxID=1461580 RepID=UPI00058ED7D0|nr:ABC transporter ATP-binding protein [Neobacillus jeddahensis]